MKDPFRITFAVLLWGLKICLSYIFLCWVVGDQRCRLHIWKAGFNKSRGLFLGMQRNSRHIQQSINLASIVTFSGDKRCDVLHLSHFWEECDALAHNNIYFNLWRFLLHPSRKTSHFGPAGTKLFWTGRNVMIRLGLKHVFLFPSQICHLCRKREAERPFGLRPTLSFL